MKSLVVYYSYSGNTKKVAGVLVDVLKEKGPVTVQRLAPIDESNNFFLQAHRAFLRKKAALAHINFNLFDYELICLGTPVWAFAPAPALNTFLNKMQNMDGRYAICFTTYGSGTGVKRCVETVTKTLKEKGASKISDFNIQQGKVNDKEFVAAQISKALQRII